MPEAGLLVVRQVGAADLRSMLRAGAASLVLGLGVFELLYGLRLLVRAGTIRFGMTYIIPVPMALFARAILPGWRHFWTRASRPGLDSPYVS